MINVNAAFKEAVTAQSRKIALKAILDITPVNVRYGDVTGSTQSPNSNSAQVYNENITLGTPAITSERNRWLIGSTFKSYDRLTLSNQSGYETSERFSNTGQHSGLSVEMSFTGVDVLQAVHLYFPNNQYDGYAVNFTLDILRTGETTPAYSETITNNRKPDLFIMGFTVYQPTSVRLTVTKWSLPYKRMRIPEIWLGMHDEWLDDMFASFSIQQQSSFTAFSLPYTTCSVALDNSQLIFDPTNKSGMFESLEERQPLDFFVCANDSDNWYQIGRFYHYSGGWKTGNSALSMTWNLVDLIGLIVEKPYTIPGTLPTTLSTWVRSILNCLGSGFANMYEIPSAYSSMALTTTKGNLKDKTCGEVLQWVCQATQTWPRAVGNGKLYVGRFDRLGQSTQNEAVNLVLDDLEQYPIIKANDDISMISIKGSSEWTIAGNSQSSPNAIAIENPFIKNEDAATTLAGYALNYYGGNLLETVGRGNPAQEVGDYVFVELSKGAFIPARVTEQTIQITDHVMKSCKTVLLCVDRIADYDSFEIITEDGDWTVPGNIEVDSQGYGQIKIIIVASGATGGHGGWAIEDDNYGENDGARGRSGMGGRYLQVEIAGTDPRVRRGQKLTFEIGKPAEPKPTARLIYDPWEYYPRYVRDDDTTASIDDLHYNTKVTINGTTYSTSSGEFPETAAGIVEPISGKRFGRTGSYYPQPGSGDGGAGGFGGHYTPETEYAFASVTEPTVGVKATGGCAIICYNKEDT